jgi:hypothetical protein
MSRLAPKPLKKEVRKPISENFAPKRLAINFEPPTLSTIVLSVVMEYLVVDTGKLYHHKMRLDSIFKKSSANRIDVLNYVKNKHYLYFLNGKIKDAQLLKFIDKIVSRRTKPAQLPKIKEETAPTAPTSNFNHDDDFDYLNDDDEYEEDYEDYEEPEDKPKQEVRKEPAATHNAFNKNTFLTYCKEYEEESNEGGAEWDLDMEDADYV